MEENGLGKYQSPEERLKDLKEKQTQDKMKFRDYESIAIPGKNDEGLAYLAEEILKRKVEIQKLEAEIEQEKQLEKEEQPPQETSLVEYSNNPVLNWFRRIADKISQILRPTKSNDEKVLKDFEKRMKDRQDELEDKHYQDIIDGHNSSNKSSELEKHNLFAEKLANAYGDTSNIVPTVENIEQTQTRQTSVSKGGDSR